MKTSDLNTKITIYQRNKTRSSDGTMSNELINPISTRAKIELSSGKESETSDNELLTQYDAKFTIRYAPSIANNMKNSDVIRVVIRNQTQDFEVTGISDAFNNKRYLLITATVIRP